MHRYQTRQTKASPVHFSMDIGEPLLFVDYDDDGKLFINPAAVDLLTSFKEPIAIIGVVGITGQAKSFTLNHFRHRNDGFKVASGDTPCTKGMWLWNTLLPQPSGPKILLLDCEGLVDHTEMGRARRHLFYLSILLSSIIIHNQIGGFIRPQKIDRLCFLTRLTTEISFTETQQEAEMSQQQDSSDFRSFFPTLIWLIHVRILLTRVMLRKQTPDQHLHKALMEQEGCHTNQIKKIIKEFFPATHCFTLPRPTNRESYYRHLDRVPFYSMRQTYKEKRDKFVEFVLRKANLDNKVLTGPMLVGITRQLIDAFNNDVVPVISLILKNVQDQGTHASR